MERPSLFLRTATVLLLLTSGCRGDAVTELSAEHVSSRIDTRLTLLESNPVGAALGLPEAGGESWAQQQLVLRGQHEGLISMIDLPSRSLGVTDGGLIPLGEHPETLELWFGDTIELTLVLGFPQALSPGLHIFRLDLPTTVTRTDGIATEPRNTALEITFRYMVADPARERETLTFCDLAVPMLNGNIPDPPSLELLIQDAKDKLSSSLAAEIERHALALSEEVVAFRHNNQGGVSTGDLVDLVGEICRVDMFAVVAAT